MSSGGAPQLPSSRASSSGKSNDGDEKSSVVESKETTLSTTELEKIRTKALTITREFTSLPEKNRRNKGREGVLLQQASAQIEDDEEAFKVILKKAVRSIQWKLFKREGDIEADAVQTLQENEHGEVEVEGGEPLEGSGGKEVKKEHKENEEITFKTEEQLYEERMEAEKESKLRKLLKKECHRRAQKALTTYYSDNRMNMTLLRMHAEHLCTDVVDNEDQAKKFKQKQIFFGRITRESMNMQI